MDNEKFPAKILKKMLGFTLLILSFGIYTHESIKTPLPFHPDSIKGKTTKINNYLWGIVFFCFTVVIFIGCVDSFIFSRPMTVKYLTRIALSLIVIITIVDFVVSFIKDNDKAPAK